ncbi:CinA family protein [uncultured Thiothrix sp.]|jgi:nicotinamide-nucleotide amidase|uniref:CinA family protein n=1 Tax=uncultured Thiothrix sp. TaxID=223185 RepID=UPI002614807B|nr:CinA family protein [uncultured Thiothrix sp.]HMT94535.1 CinA family protein [Thiolinea sp.]
MQDSVYEVVENLASQLKQANWSLVIAESCTGGGVAKACTAVAGSSSWFDSAFVVYSNAAKQRILNVPAQTIEAYGAVSEAVVLEMAKGAFQQSVAQVAVAVSGIAGPGGGSMHKPVGMVCIAAVIKNRAEWAQTFYFQGDREQIREQAILEALRLIDDLLTRQKLDEDAYPTSGGEAIN